MGKTPARQARPNKIDTVVTFLEMKRPPDAASPEAPMDGITIELEEAPSVEFYRHLYDAVGAPWLWYERRLLDDQALAAIIGDPGVEVYVLRAGGALAGYSELDLRTLPDIDIAYFGLVPRFIGRRLGPYLLGWTVERAWARLPTRLLVNTCTLDHPKALALYESFGFKGYKIAGRSFDDPRQTGVIS
ncbi:MAG: N-acetyltransferase [Rhodospirillales bacterium]|jgi:GNAT superfamily N-acetyltransferase|nr:N-acetyltransferase [Rhodospirillales bacterium]HJO71941.1 N-acetyltransferase [Rhodospirillales bacterium]